MMEDFVFIQEVPLDLGTFLIIENEQDVFIKRTAF